VQSIKVALHFAGTCHFHLQDLRVSQVRTRQEANKSITFYLNQACFLFGVLFRPEGGGEMLHQNVG
jgi:hypothetical protein